MELDFRFRSSARTYFGPFGHPGRPSLLKISGLDVRPTCACSCGMVRSIGMPLDDPFVAAPSAGERFAPRRMVPRYSRIWPVEIFEPIDRTRLSAETIQVSLKGCCAGTADSSDLAQGTIVRLRIQRGQETLEVWARVTGTSTGSEIGLAFLGTKHQEVLARWICSESNG